MLEAYSGYEDRKPGLGAEFLDAVDACLQLIIHYPLAHAKVEGEARRALLKRFPYGVFYVVGEGQISVLACLHTKRRPEILRSRL